MWPFNRNGQAVVDSPYNEIAHLEREILDYRLHMIGLYHEIDKHINDCLNYLDQIRLLRVENTQLLNPPKSRVRTYRDYRPIPQSVRTHVFKRDKGRCVVCGAIDNLHFDHIIPDSLGGSIGPENVRVLCCSCNHKKNASVGVL